MNNLAATYVDLGRTKEAAALHEKVLDASMRTLGEEHPDTLSSIYNLSVTYWRSDLYNEAIEVYERESDVCRMVHGAQHTETVMSIQSLAHRYHDVRRMKEAVLLESHLKEFEDLKGEDD